MVFLLYLWCRIAGSRLPISDVKVKKDIRAAWKYWSNAAAMKFRKRSRKEADIVISFHEGGELSLVKQHPDGDACDEANQSVWAHCRP